MSWRDAKIAALRSQVYTDYREGMKYDGYQIPTSNFVQGYGDQNRSNLNFNYWHEKGINLPENPQEMYARCGEYSSGFTLFSPKEALIEIAPIFLNIKQEQIGLTGFAVAGSRVNEPFYAMPGTNVQVTPLDITVKDVGNRIGTLTIGPVHPKQTRPVSFNFFE